MEMGYVLHYLIKSNGVVSSQTIVCHAQCGYSCGFSVYDVSYAFTAELSQLMKSSVFYDCIKVVLNKLVEGKSQFTMFGDLKFG
jgi:hypothetical protein